jgi:hypothetical protein
MKSFLWCGTDVVQGEVFGGMEQGVVAAGFGGGGLGVMDLDLFGMALHMRWFWLSCTDASHS